MTVLSAVLVLGSAIGVVATSVHVLWRGSSRTLFSVQEHRELVNLGRSALAEAVFKLQTSLDQSHVEWFDWFTAAGEPAAREFAPEFTLANASQMTSGGSNLAYRATGVTLKRRIGIDIESRNDSAVGIVDLEVTVSVQRQSPRHQARFTVVERRSFRLVDSVGPFNGAGKMIEITPTPVGTWIQES